ncbi:MAG: ATP-binding cassette domain-containing protein, partial [Anaerolineae bacterium]|nr:ATP-binding cassette domain-containing protein [Anaerolineae bacterium]
MFGLWQKEQTNEPTRDTRTNGVFTHGNAHLIDLKDVVKVYKTAAGDFTALRGINLQVDSGEFVAVIGKSGSGKSTLINMITGIDRPTSGQVFIGDTAVHTLNEGQMAQWRGRNMGIVFQFFQLLPTLTVIENVMLPMDFCNMFNRKERIERAMHLLELVDIAEQAHKLPTAISGGQQQRAAIARALANDPPIIVADEPTGNLDSRTSSQIFQLFDDLVAKENKTILMVTHDDDQARRVSRTVILADGEIANEYMARALPFLPQNKLAEATRRARHVHVNPGQVVVEEGSSSDNFYIITSGEVHVYLKQPEGSDLFVEKLGVGQYFGEIGLLRNQRRSATVRADRYMEAELVALSRKDFEELIASEASARAAIEETAEVREESQAKAREKYNLPGADGSED